jgi:hypothetical protein
MQKCDDNLCYTYWFLLCAGNVLKLQERGEALQRVTAELAVEAQVLNNTTSIAMSIYAAHLAIVQAAAGRATVLLYGSVYHSEITSTAYISSAHDVLGAGSISAVTLQVHNVVIACSASMEPRSVLSYTV